MEVANSARRWQYRVSKLRYKSSSRSCPCPGLSGRRHARNAKTRCSPRSRSSCGRGAENTRPDIVSVSRNGWSRDQPTRWCRTRVVEMPAAEAITNRPGPPTWHGHNAKPEPLSVCRSGLHFGAMPLTSERPLGIHGREWARGVGPAFLEMNAQISSHGSTGC